ncbi:hypothetical protein [Burkholderia gladioli]|uniref:hypothetical protein n=1 Tax=Burkholderia gladioli TaxID=28095 RepID=UPI00163E9E79|nr:hypothetical protein [Burkholderia gladioli]
MPSQYLQGEDLAGYGVPNATSAQIQQASAQIDVYLARREGLVWKPDGNGNPCYMAGMSPNLTLNLASAIAPGQNVVVNLTGPVSMLKVGSVLIIDAGTPAITEALVLQSILGQQATFANVQFEHAQGASLGGGLTIVEQRTMPEDRPITMVAQTPVMAILSGVGRYGYMRRGQDAVGSIDTYNLLAVMSKFGGPPAWEVWTPQANSVEPETGTVWVPAGVLLAYYTEVRMHYVAGWTYETLPAGVKQACANIVINIAAVAGMPGTMQRLQAGDTSMQRFANQPGVLNSFVMDDDTKALVNPYRARLYA